MKAKSALTKEAVEKSFKDSKYSVKSFDKQEKKKEAMDKAMAYKVTVSGMT